MQLSDKNIDASLIKFANVTISAENYVCVREEAQKTIAIVDLKSKSSPTRLPIAADSAIMNPVSKVVALRAGGHLTMYSLEMKAKMSQATIAGTIVYWKWIDPKTVAIVTTDSVFHWSLEGAGEPVKMFDRTPHDSPVQVINYFATPDGKWLMLSGLSVDANKNFNGVLQVYSVDARASQPTLNAPAATFAHTQLDNKEAKSNIFAFCRKDPATGTYTLQMLELGVPKETAFSKQAPMRFADAADFPMNMVADPKYGILYVMSQQGFVFAYEIQSGKPIFASRASQVTLFAVAPHSEDGCVAIDLKGRVVHFALDKANAVPYICNTMRDLDLGVQLARRYNLDGADHLFKTQFASLMQQNRTQEAMELAAGSPKGVLRNGETIALLKQMGGTNLLAYFQLILNKPNGKLNAVEAVELARPLLAKGPAGVEHIQNWLKQNKLEASEELGMELMRHNNPQLALSVFLRAECKDKVAACFVQLGAAEADDAKAKEHFANILKYAKKVDFTPDYASLLQMLVRLNQKRGKDLATLLVTAEDGPKMDINQVTDVFIRLNDVQNSTNIILEYLRSRGDRAEDAALQTKVLESNLLHMPAIADAILESEDYKMTHYDKIKIAQLCERAQLFQRALEHYSDQTDIKRVLTYAHTMKPEFLLDYFGKLSPELGLECLRDMLKQNLQQNIRLVVEVAKKWTEHYGAEKLVALFEEFKSFNGLYFFLGSFVNFTSNPSVVFKYIEAAIKIGPNAAKEIERVCRENNVYDPKEVKEFLMEQPVTLKDPRALIHVCNRFNYLEELTTFLFNNNLVQFLDAFVQRMAPSAAPAVVGTLIDLNAGEEQVKKMLDGIRPPADDPEWVTKVTEVLEKRNRLRLFRTWLEARVAEDSKDGHVYTSLAKVFIEGNNNPKHFLETNTLYDPLVVGAFCESRDPRLAVIVYKKGKCDKELIEVTNKNGFFKDQARYLVERMDLAAWEIVLIESNPYRRQLVDQVVSTALPESHSPDEVSVTVKAFIAADLPTELIELLERLMLRGGENASHFQDNKNLQNLLILTAVKADKKRVMEYIKRLENYDTDKIAEVCLNDANALYEEAFFIFKKAKKAKEAVAVLIDKIQDIARALDFATQVDHPDVWSLLGKAQLAARDVKAATKSLLKAEDASCAKEMINTVTALTKETSDEAAIIELYNVLIDYLRMARTKGKDASIDAELLYAFARADRLADLEDFVQQPLSGRLVDAGDRAFSEGLYKAARVIYTHLNNFAKLAMTLVKLELWQEAVDAARKAKAIQTWKFVCFACADAEKFRLAQVCGLNVIGMNEHLMDLVQHYERRGYFTELIALLEQGINIERPHQGIFTQLGVCYAKYKEEKMMEHVKLFHARANVAQLIAACRQNLLWPEAVFLCSQDEQYENAIDLMMEHSAAAWKHDLFKDVLVKCSNTEIFYRAIDFYLSAHPLLLSDVLLENEKKLDHSRVVSKVKNAEHLPLIQSYLVHVQHSDLPVVNEAINDLYILEENHRALRGSIEDHSSFDQMGLAVRLQKHELLEFRRIAALLYKKSERFEQSIDLSKKDEFWQDAIDTATSSKDPALCESLLRFFVAQKLEQCFSAMLYTCYDFITPDIVLELAWRHNLTNFAMPYMIQTFQSYNARLATVEKRLDAQVREKVEEKKAKEEEVDGAQDAVGLGLTGVPPHLMAGANAPLMLTHVPGMGSMGAAPMPGMGMGMGGMGGMGGMPGMGGPGGFY